MRQEQARHGKKKRVVENGRKQSRRYLCRRKRDRKKSSLTVVRYEELESIAARGLQLGVPGKALGVDFLTTLSLVGPAASTAFSQQHSTKRLLCLKRSTSCQSVQGDELSLQ